MKANHLAIAVKDVKEARGLWSKLFQCSEPEIHELTDRGVFACAFHLENLIIELVQPINESSPIWKFITEKGGGLHHLALESDDIDADIESGKANGFKFLGEKPVEGLDKTKIIFLHPKTLGVLVELVQPSE